MAKLCYMCSELCVFLVLFLRISIASSNKDFYSYKTVHPHHVSEYSIDLVSVDLLENEQLHSVRKRQSPPMDDVHESSANATKLEVPTKNKTVKVPKTTNATKVILKDTPFKNLGVNGTGQRRNITSNTVNISTVEPYSPSTPPLQMQTNNDSTVARNNQTGGDDDEISIAKFPDPDFNKTLADHNITISRQDSHTYYNSTFKTDRLTGEHYWVDMNNRSDVKVNDLLSRSHRRAATIKLSFDFPFYGHLIKSVTIATGGFLYTGDYVHSWLAATQYIAPLMANFDTSLSNDSYIKYVDNGTAFTVEWEKVALQDKPDDGEFTFQVTLHSNGDIVFVYQNIPSIIEKIQDDHHPVKVGLSDAYIMDRQIFFVRRKTIYEYHRVNFYHEDIKNWTVIYLNALPTCLVNTDCQSCLSKEIKSFECSWCPNINRCSDGLDRHRQEWLARGCDKRQILNATMCSHAPGTDIYDNDDVNSYKHEGFEEQPSRVYQDSRSIGPQQPDKMGVSGIIAILFLLSMVSGLAIWVFYAYRNPHTTSGQMLIRYRPSQWRWRLGEARYTAATIHM